MAATGEHRDGAHCTLHTTNVGKKTLIYPHKETLELRNKGDVNTRAEKYEWMTINADSIQSPVKGCVMSRDRRETRC